MIHIFALPNTRFCLSRKSQAPTDLVDGWHLSFTDMEHQGDFDYVTLRAEDDRRRILGYIGYSRTSDGTIRSTGSFVKVSARGQGVASALWEYAIAYEKPKQIALTAVSDLGYTLIQSLKLKYKNLKFIAHEEGHRKLRVLKKQPQLSQMH